ncbi:11252_t:CDS:2, partial [Funneliformis mosseae]
MFLRKQENEISLSTFHPRTVIASKNGEERLKGKESLQKKQSNFQQHQFSTTNNYE